MPIGNPAFGPTGAPGGHPDARALLRSAGELALPLGGYPGAVLLTGEPSTTEFSGVNTGTPTRGFLYLTRVPVVGPHIVAVGLDPAVALGCKGARFGLYRAVRGVPYELLIDCGSIDATDGDPAHCFCYLDFAVPESVEVFVGWVYQLAGAEFIPTSYVANDATVIGSIVVPGDADPAAAQISWNNTAGSPGVSWQQNLADASPFNSSDVLPDGGFLYYPRRSAGRYGVTGSLPEALPQQFGIYLDGVDAVSYGFGPDGGNNGGTANYRAVVKLADS